jgi:hypothetical protein
MTELPLTGGCLCGAVRFEIDKPPLFASYCHCTRCQKRTGTGASANVRIERGSLRWTQGEGSITEWTPEGGGAVKAFCSTCGGHLYSRPADADEPAGVRLGAVDGDPGVRPAFRQYTAYAVSWEAIPEDGLPRFPEAARAAPAPPSP